MLNRKEGVASNSMNGKQSTFWLHFRVCAPNLTLRAYKKHSSEAILYKDSSNAQSAYHPAAGMACF